MLELDKDSFRIKGVFNPFWAAPFVDPISTGVTSVEIEKIPTVDITANLTRLKFIGLQPALSIIKAGIFDPTKNQMQETTTKAALNTVIFTTLNKNVDVQVFTQFSNGTNSTYTIAGERKEDDSAIGDTDVLIGDPSGDQIIKIP